MIAKVLQDNKSKGELLAAGAQLVDDASGKSVVTPSLIKSLMGQRHFLFAGFGQQDSHEFISQYLEDAHRELCPKKNEYKIFDYDEAKSVCENLIAYKKFLDDFEKSELVDCLQFILLKTFKCQKCQHQSHMFQNETQLILPLDYVAVERDQSTDKCTC